MKKYKAGQRVKLNPVLFSHLRQSKIDTHGYIVMAISPFCYCVQWDNNTHECLYSNWLLEE